MSDRELLKAVRDALDTLIDPTPCRWDHNKSCQEHGFLTYDGTCGHQTAKVLLARLDAALAVPHQERKPAEATVTGEAERIACLRAGLELITRIDGPLMAAQAVAVRTLNGDNAWRRT